MTILVREMVLEETGIIIDYFHGLTPEELDLQGVDPTRLPPRDTWPRRIEQEYALPFEDRTALVLIWLVEDRPIGFSSCDKIALGQHATMHLHVTMPDRRNRGIGVECVRQSVKIYFERLSLKQLFCEPNAFNTAPNRTLQKAGFRYVKTHKTVPGPLNFHQAVTRWVFE